VKRLRRILLNTAAALSLLLCLATAADWVNSYRGYWVIRHETESGVRIIASDYGGLYLFRETAERTSPDPGPTFTYCVPRLGPFAALERVFETNAERWKPVRVLSRSGKDFHEYCVIIAHWVLVPPFAALPLLRFRAWRRHRRRAISGMCPKCGYDLRATPERCPECGTVPT
jgi:hypothetical protein